MSALSTLELTFATLLSVPASVTMVGCMTLCTARLYNGMMRFPLCDVVDVALSPPELDCDESTELERFSVLAVPVGGCSAVGVASASLGFSKDCRWGVLGPELRSPLGTAARVGASDPRRGRVFFSGITSWTWRLRGFFAAVGGGLTSTNVYHQRET